MQKTNDAIIQRFSKLSEACQKYPALDLHVNCKATIHKECNSRTKDGFIEKFCKSNLKT